MAVTWYWNHVLGEIVRKSDNPHMKPTYKGRLLGGGNVMAALAYKANADENGQAYKKPVWTMYGEFWDDQTHLSRMLGLAKGKNWRGEPYENLYTDVVKLRLNTYYWKEIQPIAKLFAKAGIKVELYYQVPKHVKKKEQ